MNDILSQTKRFILYAGDIFLFYLVLAAVLAMRYPENFGGEIWKQHFLPFTVMFVIWIIVAYISGLYDQRITKNDINFYALVVRTVLIDAGLGVLYFYIFSNRFFSIKPQVVLAIYLAIFSVIFLLWRRLYNQMTQAQTFQQKVLFVGSGQEVNNLIAELRQKPYLGYRVVGHLLADDGAGRGNISEDALNWELEKILTGQKVDTVVTALELHKLPLVIAQFYKHLFLGIKYVDFPVFYEKLTGKVPVNTIGQMWFLENLSENEKRLYEFSKRIAEIVLTVIFSALSLVMAPFISLAIKIDSPGPVLFKQDRVGKNGRVFKAMKFRTMLVGAEKNGPQWAIENDPRVTRVGRFLRKTRLDEIPQFLNILRGDMSFIGPRPERPEFVSELTKKIPYYNERHLIKPGLTGWAQVNFRYGSAVEDALEKLQYDLYYIKNRSLGLDAGVILKTINTILSRKGQ